MSDRLETLHRVDPRLVHSTLIEAWVPFLEATTVVVADGLVAEDPRSRLIFEMSARDVGCLHFVDERDVAAALGRLGAGPVVVVYGSLEAFERALDGGLGCDQLVIGHLPDGEGRRRVHPSVYVGSPELAAVDRIRARGVDVVVRPLPGDLPRRLRQGEDHRPVLTEDLGPTLPTSGRSAPSGPGYGDPSPGLDDSTDVPTPGPGARQAALQVVNERGLHLRAAHLLAQCCSRFRSSIQVGRGDDRVNAKSLLGITTLGAGRGTSVTVWVEGPDADDALAAVVALFASGFDEGAA